MKIEKIKSTLKNYNDLINYAKSKIGIMGELDDIYRTGNYGIEEISFSKDSDTVYVKCDDSSFGCYDSFSFNFPVEWLTKSNNELKEIVLNEKEIRLKIEAEEVGKYLKESERIEYEKYLKLKNKYEKHD